MRRCEPLALLALVFSLALTQAKDVEFRLIQANNIQRQELLQQKCDGYEMDINERYQNNSIHSLSDADLEHLLIDRKHKLLYCYVPKVSTLDGAILPLPRPSSVINRWDNLRVSWKCQVESISCPTGPSLWKVFSCLV